MTFYVGTVRALWVGVATNRRYGLNQPQSPNVTSIQALCFIIHPMTIQYCSDLHLEFDTNRTFLSDCPIEPVGDVLVLAGDVSYLNYYRTRTYEQTWFKQLCKQFQQVYWLAGNHEFYRNDSIADWQKPIHTQLKPNLWAVNNVKVSYLGVNMVFSTLWTHIDQLNEKTIQRGMSDFHLTSYEGKPLMVKGYNALHESAKAFLTPTLHALKDEPTVVISHHLPTYRCEHKRHEGSLLSQGFVVKLDDFITETQPDYWIYGHSNANMPETQIGKTKLITNRLGYVSMGEMLGYSACKSIKL